MTRIGPRRTVDSGFWEGRLAQARAYLAAARQAAVVADPSQSANPIVSQIVLSAIAYGDYLTAKRAGVVNRQDHAAAPRLLRDVLRGNLPVAQESRYRRILATKDESQYGARSATVDFARRLLADLEEFARWAEDQP
jgi:hypothetical protein